MYTCPTALPSQLNPPSWTCAMGKIEIPPPPTHSYSGVVRRMRTRLPFFLANHLAVAGLCMWMGMGMQSGIGGGDNGGELVGRARDGGWG